MSASIDFLHRPRAPAVGWLGLLAGALALSAALGYDGRVATALDAARARQTRIDLEKAQRQAVRAPEPTPGERRAALAERESRAPWLATLRAIESLAQDPVYLRALAIEPATDVVKVEAEAPSFADALAFVELLDRDPLLRPAALGSHEQVDDPSTGGSVVRFHVAARWNRR